MPIFDTRPDRGHKMSRLVFFHTRSGWRVSDYWASHRRDMALRIFLLRLRFSPVFTSWESRERKQINDASSCLSRDTVNTNLRLTHVSHPLLLRQLFPLHYSYTSTHLSVCPSVGQSSTTSKIINKRLFMYVPKNTTNPSDQKPPSRLCSCTTC